MIKDLDESTLKVLLEKGMISEKDIETLNKPEFSTKNLRESINEFVLYLKKE